jgi:hypothetical protein
VVATAALAAAVAAPVLAWVRGPEVAYLATPARAAEVLAGATLACLWHEGRLHRSRAILAPACLGALVALAVVLPADGGLAYRGGLPVVALLSAGLLHGLQAPGRVRTALSWAPVAGLGRISYGVYLFHWPILLIVDEARTGWHGPALLGARVATSVVLATASYLAVERGIREAGWRPIRTGFVATTAVGWTAVLAVLLVQAPPAPLGPSPAAAHAVAISAPTHLDLALPDADETKPKSPLLRPARILVLGDSTAMALGAGLVEWAVENPGLAQVTVSAVPGCGFLLAGEPAGPVDREACADWAGRIPSLVADLQPDAVLLMTSGSDILERSFDGGPSITAAEPAYRPELEAAYQHLTDVILSSTDATLGWVRPPTPRPYWLDRAPLPYSSWRVFDDLVADLAAEHPERSAVVDLRGYLVEHELDDAEDVRPDGIHLSDESGLAITRDWLGPLLLHLASGDEG